jgi:hypothetical protein
LFLIQWFTYYRYFLNYYLANRKNQLVIDTSSKTIECRNDAINHSNVAQNISQIILYRHVNFEREYYSPKSIKENMVNILSDGPGRRRFRNLWYIEIRTNGDQKFYITPFMTKLSDFPFQEIKIEFIEKPKIEYGS